jgi:hypothetical protein
MFLLYFLLYHSLIFDRLYFLDNHTAITTWQYSVSHNRIM